MILFEPVGDSALKAQVRVSASPERIYRAWTDPAEFVLWFRGSSDGRLEIHNFDCREGGSYDVTIVNGKGDRFNLVGTYLTLSPGKRIVMTWAWVTGEPIENPMRVTVDLEPHPTGCMLTLVHERFGSSEERNMHHEGWAPCLQNLVDLVSPA